MKRFFLGGIAKLASRAGFSGFFVGSIFCKVTYPFGHRRFAKNQIQQKKHKGGSEWSFAIPSLAMLLLPFLACASIYSPPYYFPPSCHWMIALSALGDTLEIEDGSVWKVDPYECSQIHYWRSNDPLVLTQNRDWFSSFDYRIVNQTTGGSTGVNLFLGPILESEHARFLSALDLHRGELILTDGSRWVVCPRDMDLFQKWILDDCILIGSNSGWESSFDCILINSNMNHFIRAKQF